jgi:hypothetical protein
MKFCYTAFTRRVNIVTKEFISKASLLKNLPLPLFGKEGYIVGIGY